MAISKDNNFDLIRLIAALQVAVVHSAEHLHLNKGFLKYLIDILIFIPGVPIFFTVSGFLIFASYDRNRDLRIYFRNRLLRIYPGLWVCLIFTIIVLTSFGYINSNTVLRTPFFAWLITQMSFLQFYTPEFFRGFGVGNPNGSLWTIPVEISFYVFVPIVFYLIKNRKRTINYILLTVCLLSYLFNLWYGVNFKSETNNSPFIKLLGLTLLPYLFYFMFGALAYINWGRIKHFYENKGLHWLCIYVTYSTIFSVWLHKFEPSYWPNIYGLISVILLSQVVLSLAYTSKNISKLLIDRNDISFGIYLYHMPIVNLLLSVGFLGRTIGLYVTLVLTIILSFLSWRLVEKPLLKIKRNQTNKAVT